MPTPHELQNPNDPPNQHPDHPVDQVPRVDPPNQPSPRPIAEPVMLTTPQGMTPETTPPNKRTPPAAAEIVPTPTTPRGPGQPVVAPPTSGQPGPHPTVGPNGPRSVNPDQLPASDGRFPDDGRGR